MYAVGVGVCEYAQICAHDGGVARADLCLPQLFLALFETESLPELGAHAFV